MFAAGLAYGGVESPSDGEQTKAKAAHEPHVIFN